MGTIAARDCLRVLELTEQVAAAHLLATTQAITLRHQEMRQPRNSGIGQLSERIIQFVEAVLAEFTMLEEDRPLEADLRRFVNHIQHRVWSLYE